MILPLLTTLKINFAPLIIASDTHGQAVKVATKDGWPLTDNALLEIFTVYLTIIKEFVLAANKVLTWIQVHAVSRTFHTAQSSLMTNLTVLSVNQASFC